MKDVQLMLQRTLPLYMCTPCADNKVLFSHLALLLQNQRIPINAFSIFLLHFMLHMSKSSVNLLKMM